MTSFPFFKLTLAGILSTAVLSYPSLADINITAEEVNGDVVLTYNGSIRTAELSNAGTIIRGGSIAPSNSLVQFATTSGSEIVTEYADEVTSAPADFGTGGTTTASSETGDIFTINSRSVAFDQSYTSGNSIMGTLTFSGATFASLGMRGSATPYVWTLANGETVSLTIPAPPVAAPDTTAIRSKIRKLKKKLKNARKKMQKSKIKKFRKQLKALNKQL